MAFSFGFSGDDIEEDPNDLVADTQQSSVPGGDSTSDQPPPIPAKTHDLDELLSSVPDKLSYSIVSVTSPKGFSARLPRRDLFDVRLQLMAEDDGTKENVLAGLDDSDLQTNVYEGGYKTWECSLDLAKYLLDRGPRKDLDDIVRVNHIIELGCGSAIPSLLLFQYALKNQLPMAFTLADYNADVVRLVTLPNLVLAWAATLSAATNATLFTEPDAPNRLASPDDENGDLYLTPAILAAFRAALTQTGIQLSFLSGAWTPAADLLGLIPSAHDLNTLVLGSETIYSPASLEAFADALTALMKRVAIGKALVAAKRVYFGVGGGVDAFREACARRGAVAAEVEFEGLETGGVRRCLLEVQMC